MKVWRVKSNLQLNATELIKSNKIDNYKIEKKRWNSDIIIDKFGSG